MNSFLLSNIAVFNPKGFIASEQKEIIIRAVCLMLIAVIPVLVATFVIVWKYRAGKNAKYTPTFDRSPPLQFAWVAILSAIILVLAVIAWKGAHALDPRKPLTSNVPPLTIQVVALQWKWLFIYPDLNIATVNFVQFPEDTPINFEITADAPMNSFWIPELGGQMYAMSGMKTKLHVMADEAGEYRGLSTNISGEGFAGMHFIAKASSTADFGAWVETVRFYGNDLDFTGYEQLAKPSKNHPTVSYAATEDNLFDKIIKKLMPPAMEQMDHK